MTLLRYVNEIGFRCRLMKVLIFRCLILAVLARYYDSKECKATDALLGTIEIDEGSAENHYRSVKILLSKETFHFLIHFLILALPVMIVPQC